MMITIHEVSSLNGESSVSGEKLEIDDYNNDNKMGYFQSADAHENGEAIDNKEKESETDKVIERVDGSSKLDFDENLNDEVTVSGLDKVLHKEIPHVSVYENSMVLDANNSYKKSVSSLPSVD